MKIDPDDLLDATEVADVLGLAHRQAVATYRSRLMAKLRVSDVAGLVRLAVRFGLVDGDDEGEVRKRRATDVME